MKKLLQFYLMYVYIPLAFSFLYFVSVKCLNKVNTSNSQTPKVMHDRKTESGIPPDKFKFFF